MLVQSWDESHVARDDESRIFQAASGLDATGIARVQQSVARVEPA